MKKILRINSAAPSVIGFQIPIVRQEPAEIKLGELPVKVERIANLGVSIISGEGVCSPEAHIPFPIAIPFRAWCCFSYGFLHLFAGVGSGSGSRGEGDDA